MSDRIGTLHAQDAVVAYLTQDSNFLRSCRDHLPVETLDSPVARAMVQVCYEYWDQYHQAPKSHVRDLFGPIWLEQFTQNRELAERFLVRMNTLQFNPQFLEQVTAEFCQDRVYELKGRQLLDAVGRGRYPEARGLAREMAQFEFLQADPSEDLVSTGLGQGTEFYYRIGIRALDRWPNSLVPGAVGAILGSAGVGKSWLLCHIANGLTVRAQPGYETPIFIYTPELSKEQMARRLMMNAMSLCTVGQRTARYILPDPSNRKLEAIHTQARVPQYDEAGAGYDEVVATLDRLVRIKDSKKGQPTVGMVEGWVESYRNHPTHPFNPRILLVDGVNYLQPKGSKAAKWERVLEMWNELIDLAGRTGVLILGVVHSDKKSQKTGVAFGYQAEFSKKILDNSDFFMSIQVAKPNEESLPINDSLLNYLTVEKNRVQGQLFRVKTYGCLLMGQFAIDSVYKGLWTRAG